jgi:hypothetical protein
MQVENKLDTTKYRVVRVKTLDEFFDTGWSIASEGNYCQDDHYKVSFTFPMKFLAGRIIPIHKSSINSDYIYGEVPDAFIITEDMIAEEFNPEDYPEFFI